VPCATTRISLSPLAERLFSLPEVTGVFLGADFITVTKDGAGDWYQLKPAIRAGSILIDATVPLAASVGGRASRTLGVWQGSAAQQTAELVPKGVSVVAAFQNVSADVLNGNLDDDVDCDVIVCSDDPNTTQIAMELAVKIPRIRAIDGGKLENARIIEQITALLIGLNLRHKGHSGIRITGLPDAAYKSLTAQ